MLKPATGPHSLTALQEQTLKFRQLDCFRVKRLPLGFRHVRVGQDDFRQPVIATKEIRRRCYTCRLVLSKDPNWFSREWTKDGRRPNPTYGTPCQALEEIIRSLQAMKETLTKVM